MARHNNAALRAALRRLQSQHRQSVQRTNAAVRRYNQAARAYNNELRKLR